MNLRITTLITAVLIALGLGAKEPLAVGPIEFGLQGGITTPLLNRPHFTKSTGWDAGVELMYNFKHKPWAVGPTIRMISIERENVGLPDMSVFIRNFGLQLGVAGEYNFNRGYALNPYVGASTGMVFIADQMDEDNPDGYMRPFIRPHVGLEIVNRFRFEAALLVTERYSTSLSLTLGFRFGGGPK